VITITLNMFMALMCVSAIAGGLALWTSERMIADYHRLQEMEHGDHDQEGLGQSDLIQQHAADLA
jgi:hypothetical protein